MYLNREHPYIELPCASDLSGLNAIGNGIALPDKLGTSPMELDGSNGSRTGKRERGVDSLSKH